MAGLIDNAQAQAQGITPEAIRSKLHIPPNLQNAYERLVLAGKKVMYDEKTHNVVLQQMQDIQGPIEQQLGQSIAGLMVILYNQSKGAMPPSLLIPAGTELTAEAADFLKKSGQQINDQQIAQAIVVMTQSLLKKFKIDPNKLNSVIDSRAAARAATLQPQPAQQGV
jgi:hypothetical protein